MDGRNSVMTHQFSRVPEAEIQRSSFDRSHGYKTTFNGGYLIPVLVDEALPGDTFSLNMSAFARMATPLKPLMDNLFLDSFFFAVPYRLVWDNWEKFNGAQDDPGDSTDFTIPQMTGPNVAAGGITAFSLSDYFGLPTGPLNVGGGTTGLTFNSLHHRAYNLIWNEWFRDQNLQDSVVVDKDDGPDTYADYTDCLRRGKRHDYFTSALPWPQKGDDVSLPLGATAPVIPDPAGIDTSWFLGGNTRKLTMVSGSTGTTWGTDPGVSGTPRMSITGLVTDLATATAATINSIREAFQLQRLLERDARGGTRYTEILKAHFGVTSPDARLQRPEYLGGGSTPINVHPVAGTNQESDPSSETPQGNLAAFATASFSGHGFTKSFTEHCLIIGMVSVRADLTYQQGVNRMFNRRTRYDFYWPALSHLGEQEILNREIFAYCPDGTGATEKDGVFGYQERFAEYRYKPSQITGAFRSQYATTLDIWHLSEEFAALPTLNAGFIRSNPPIERVIAVPSEPQFLFDAYFKYRCARPMPVYGVPGMIDHF